MSRRKFIKQVGVGVMGFSALPIIPACGDKMLRTKSNLFSSFPRCTPEEQGVSSQVILEFLNAVNNSNLEFHSIMLLRNAHVVAEGWWSPFAPEMKHTLYSLSKSFTSTAVGLAISEGKLSVEDNVLSFFPVDAPAQLSHHLSLMKVKHLLTMNTGHKEKPITKMQEAEDGNWAKVYLSYEVPYPPGTHFLYNTGASYMLSAIVQKVVGQNIFDYLNDKLFKPLKITNADWEMDPNGICVGGYGLRLRTEDIANFGQLYLQKGQWNGQQILPSDWVEEATKKQSESQEGDNDWSQGYGYQFWRCKPEPGFYRGDGAFGQYCIVIPQKNVVIAVTSESSDMQASMNLIWDHLLPGITDQSFLPANIENQKLLFSTLNSLHLPVLEQNISSGLQDKIHNKIFHIESNSNSVESLQFSFDELKCSLEIKFKSGVKVLTFGYENWIIKNNELAINSSLFIIPEDKKMNSKVAGCAGWLDSNTLILKLKFLEGVHSDTWTCIFDNNRITISFQNSVHTLQRTDDKRPDWSGKFL